MNKVLLCTALAVLLLSTPHSVSAQEILTVEVFVDSDPGFGKGRLLEGTIGENIYHLSLVDISPGAHIVSTRVKDAEGRWSATVTNPLYISDDRLYTAAEYFIDADPGQGEATALPVGGRTLTFQVPTHTLELGTHTLGVRVAGVDGRWTDVMTCAFVVVKGAPVITGDRIEYFFDKDPGFGMGVQLAANEETNLYFLPTEGLAPGAHLISVRARDTDGRWSPTVTNPLYVAQYMDVISAEYFIDRDLGQGNGIPVALSTDGEASFAVPTTQLAIGKHTLILRGTTSDEQYVTLFEAPFTINESNGITSVEWNMSIKATRIAETIIVSGESMTAGTQVDIYTITGEQLFHTVVTMDGESVSLHVDNLVGPYIIVMTTPDGERMAQRIL